MGFTPADFLMMQRLLDNRRANAHYSEPKDDAVGAGREVEDLHTPACRWLTEHGLAFVHNRPDKRSTATEGAPDFVVIVPTGTIWIEFKTKTGKLTEEQQTWHFLAARQGVKVQVLRSFDSFLELMRESGVE